MISQLALAHERQLIQKGCSLHLVVTPQSAQNAVDEMTSSSSDTDARAIKVQLTKPGLLKQKYVNLDDILPDV